MSDSTKKGDKTSAGNPITTASPIGHEELEANTGVEQKGTPHVEEHQPRTGNPRLHDIPDQTTNPRKPGVSPNTDK